MSSSSSNYNNNTGEASWLNSTGTQNILKVEDITKGRKVIDIALKDNNISFDSTALINTLSSQSARLSKSPKQIGARIKLNCDIMSQWGNQIISDKNIVKSRDGCFDIKFPTALSNATCGVNVSMQSNKSKLDKFQILTIFRSVFVMISTMITVGFFVWSCYLLINNLSIYHVTLEN